MENDKVKINTNRLQATLVCAEHLLRNTEYQRVLALSEDQVINFNICMKPIEDGDCEIMADILNKCVSLLSKSLD
jgi:hypothetical protein